MKLVTWNFQKLSLPMVDMGPDFGSMTRRLYCTAKVLGKALNLSDSALRVAYHRNKERIKPLSVTSTNAKAWLLEHKNELGIQRLRSDMLFLRARDCLLIALRSDSSLAVEFQEELLDKCEELSTVDTVPMWMHDKLAAEVGEMKQVIERFATSANQSASLAGKVLQSQAAHKQFRVIDGGLAS